MTNTIMDRTASPAYIWLLALMHVCFILNITFNTTIGGVPLTHATSSTTNIRPILRFYWWQPVYYHLDDSSFSFEENVGHALTFKVLTDDMSKIIFAQISVLQITFLSLICVWIHLVGWRLSLSYS